MEGIAAELNVVVLTKGAERYVFLYDDAHLHEALGTLGRWATNQELSFTWFDAAIVARKIRDQRQAEA